MKLNDCLLESINEHVGKWDETSRAKVTYKSKVLSRDDIQKR